MTRENAAQFLPLVQALAEGKTIQFNSSDIGWVDVPCPEFTSDASFYRIKPEPRTLIVWINNDGRVREDSTRSAPHGGEGWEKIRVREILD